MLKGATIEDNVEMLDRISDLLFSFVLEHGGKPVNSYFERDRNLIIQMIFSKGLMVKKLLEGLEYELRTSKKKLNQIQDPVALAPLVRQAFETAAMHNAVFISPTTEDSRTIAYALWNISSLNYRQRYRISNPTDDIQQIQEDEKREIKEFHDAIEATDLYKAFDARSIGIINSRMDKKEYLLRFNDSSVDQLVWHQTFDLMGYKQQVSESTYSYLSLYAHPSAMSVNTFEEMYKKNSSAYKDITLHLLSYFTMFLSTFIADAIKGQPELLAIFEQQEIETQIAINWKVSFARSREDVINSTMDLLD